MRTTLDIDDELMESLVARLPDASKTEAIETAIRAYLAHEAIKWFRENAGKIEIEDVSAELRRIDRR